MFKKIIAIVILLIVLSFAKTTSADTPTTWPHVFREGGTSGKYVALSFDDGPMPDTSELLWTLDNLGVKATFFVCGNYCSWRPELLQAIADAGHEIGNHTYDHPRMITISTDEMASQIETTNEIITSWTGIIPTLFRPPGGRYDQSVVDVVYRHNMTTVLWTASCADYLEPTSRQIVSSILGKVHPGAVILLHEGIPSTREALPEIVHTLQNRGYTFVTVGEMVELNYGPCPWPQGDRTCDEEEPSDIVF
jgi:peptidoglycan-N-acetylglucosamine deacetylase